MITLYSGTPGSGKSLHMARKIMDSLRFQDILVVCNFDCNWQSIKHRRGTFLLLDNADLTPEKLHDIARDWFQTHKFGEGKINLYIDECQLLFNAREWAKTGRNEWLSFFTQHRKLGFDIFLIAQFDRMIDRQIRSLIEYEVQHRKVSNIGVGGKIFSLLAGGGLFVALRMWYPQHERIGTDWFKYRRKYGSFYDTYKDF